MHNPAVSPHRHIKPVVVTWATGINRDPGCGGIVDPDLVLGHSQGSDVTTAPGGNADHPVLHGPCSSVALGHQRDPR